LIVYMNVNVKDDVVKVIIHGGNDSYIEELLPMMYYFSKNNKLAYFYEVHEQMD